MRVQIAIAALFSALFFAACKDRAATFKIRGPAAGDIGEQDLDCIQKVAAKARDDGRLWMIDAGYAQNFSGQKIIRARVLYKPEFQTHEFVVTSELIVFRSAAGYFNALPPALRESDWGSYYLKPDRYAFIAAEGKSLPVDEVPDDAIWVVGNIEPLELFKVCRALQKPADVAAVRLDVLDDSVVRFRGTKRSGLIRRTGGTWQCMDDPSQPGAFYLPFPSRYLLPTPPRPANQHYLYPRDPGA